MRQTKLDFLAERHVSMIGHSGASLLEHLVGTEALLRQWKLENAICDAGLFHSVYGTETFRTSLASPEERSDVAGLIGDRAERLAFLFCTMVKSSLDDNLDAGGDYSLVSRLDGAPIAISRDEFVALAHISLANWIEQRDRHGPEWRDYRAAAFRAMAPLLTAGAQQAIWDTYGA